MTIGWFAQMTSALPQAASDGGKDLKSPSHSLHPANPIDAARIAASSPDSSYPGHRARSGSHQPPNARVKHCPETVSYTHLDVYKRQNLLQLAHGSVVELDAMAGEPMDVLVNGTLIAQGEVVVVNDKFGIRLTDIITPSERVRKLNR